MTDGRILCRDSLNTMRLTHTNRSSICYYYMHTYLGNYVAWS